jgi:mannose-1-phosphate guanylyltransferase
MKAFLLAAGHGTRLRPLTDHLPKCLVPIRGEPILEIWLRQCEIAGIDEVLINIHAHAQQVREYLDAHPRRVRVTVVEEPVLLGSAGTIRSQRSWVAGEREFWIFYSDVLTNCDLERMRSFHHQRNAPVTLGVYSVAEPSRCGIVVVDQDGMIVDFEEKPAHPRSNLAFSGLLLAGPELLGALPDSDPSDLGFHVLPKFVHKMYAYQVVDYLTDIGTIHNYGLAQKQWPGLVSEKLEC